MLPLLLTAAAALRAGVGIYDITGPAQDVNLMGMANPAQKAEGILQRLRARAFVFADGASRPVAFASLDAGMGGFVLKQRVLAALAASLPGVFDDASLTISGTHSHSGPSGFLQYTIFQFAGSGWVAETIDAFVSGTAEAIVRAYRSLAPARLTLASAEVADAAINRSPTAYLLNPAEERRRYAGDLDQTMVQLHVLAPDGTPRGLANWFAVHGTSLNNTNRLLSGDNKGHAAYLLEARQNGPTSDASRAGAGPFVAAFASTALGDVSPNTAGAVCRGGARQGEPCDTVHSTCPDDDGRPRAQLCTAAGPGADMYDSSRLIAQRQADVSAAMLDGAARAGGVEGAVRGVLSYVPLGEGVEVHAANGSVIGTTCAAAMGEAFAAGTTDGPGMFDFNQAGNSSNPLFKFLASFLRHASPKLAACQAPKPVLLPTGEINFPWPWAPSSVPVQLLQLGQHFIAALPTELTTMAGRRLRAALAARLAARGLWQSDSLVWISGLANGYADYTTTYEEYQQQRYEGGSTIFGPHQLQAYIEALLSLADHLAAGTTPPLGTPPKDFSHDVESSLLGDLLTPPRLKAEEPPRGRAFGDVLLDAPPQVAAGGEVRVAFVGGNLRNDPRVQDSFVRVEAWRQGGWRLVAEDADPTTRLLAQREEKHVVLTAVWQPPVQTAAGQYRITLHGAWMKNTACNICPEKLTPVQYNGTSRTFALTPPQRAA
ncbi:hypothetical protein AB1Y20_007761 [Prymnesium parvum]|uniref:Neutral ceramidase n=1 Tax=Prymnesium parvum TaxID=97485 RepID=A0AB34IRV3_PRYPA